MDRSIDQFCGDIRARLVEIESGLVRLKSATEGNQVRAEVEVRAHLDSVRRRIEERSVTAAAAGAEIARWADEKMAVSNEQLGLWRVSGMVDQLRERAAKAERYAAAASDLAAAALDRAEAASLEAWLAHQDVKTAQRIAFGHVG
jgi:hypothetical protein